MERANNWRQFVCFHRSQQTNKRKEKSCVAYVVVGFVYKTSGFFAISKQLMPSLSMLLLVDWFGPKAEVASSKEGLIGTCRRSYDSLTSRVSVWLTDWLAWWLAGTFWLAKQLVSSERHFNQQKYRKRSLLGVINFNSALGAYQLELIKMAPVSLISVSLQLLKVELKIEADDKSSVCLARQTRPAASLVAMK